MPVSADLERCFADDPQGVAATIYAAAGTGIAGCSIEDATGRPDEPIYDAALAKERVAAAVEAARDRLVITARAENHLHGRNDLGDTIARLQSYQEAGAHVLYAPGLTTAQQIRDVVSSVDRPVNVLALPNAPTVAELAELGVARISVGGAFALRRPRCARRRGSRTPRAGHATASGSSPGRTATTSTAPSVAAEPPAGSVAFRVADAARCAAGSLLDGDGLGEVARLVDLAAEAARGVVGQQLPRGRSAGSGRVPARSSAPRGDAPQAAELGRRWVIATSRPPRARISLDRAAMLRSSRPSSGTISTVGTLRSDQRERAVLELARLIRLGVPVGDLLELLRSLPGDGEAPDPPDEEQARRPREQRAGRGDPRPRAASSSAI